jgi:hypothetical protein
MEFGICTDRVNQLKMPLTLRNDAIGPVGALFQTESSIRSLYALSTPNSGMRLPKYQTDRNIQKCTFYIVISLFSLPLALLLPSASTNRNYMYKKSYKGGTSYFNHASSMRFLR